MGYVLAIIALVIVALLLLPILAARRAPRPHGGVLESDHPVSRTEPAADEANPSASVTASSRQQENARRHTPPA